MEGAASCFIISDGFSSISDDYCSISIVPDPLSYYCLHDDKPLLTEKWRGLIREVGQVFLGGVKEFRCHLSKFSIQGGFKFSYVKNDSTRVTAECYYKAENRCFWPVHARLNNLNGYFYIMELDNVHTCGSTLRPLKNKRMSSAIVASEIGDDIRTNLLVGPAEVKMKLKNSHGLDLTYDVAWLAVEKARSKLFGDHNLSYEYLKWYTEESSKTNPGSKFALQYDNDNGRFRRLFVSFEACIHGFNYCRPLLFLDGTFLKGRYKGILLAVTGKDGDGGLFHLSFAIVDSENEENWQWFMEQLKCIIPEERTITFISDRNKGLLDDVSGVFPNSHHGFCLRQLKANLRDKLHGFSKDFKEKMISKLHFCAYTPTIESCESAMGSIKIHCKDAVDKFLVDARVQNWTNAHFRGKRSGEMTSNAAESFNAWILIARSLTATNLVYAIRQQLMVDFTKNRKLGEVLKCAICPTFDKMLQSSIDVGKSWVVYEASKYVFEIKSTPTVVVNLEARTCSCFKWQLNSFPCVHAVAAIRSSNSDLSTFVDRYFHVEYFRMAYAHNINPVPTLGRPIVRLEDIVIRPLKTKRQPGRPKLKRMGRRDENSENVKEITCSSCGLKGSHNRKTCTRPLD